MVIECLSGSDGKEGIAKAANLLYSASCKGCNNYAPYTRGCDKMVLFLQKLTWLVH